MLLKYSALAEVQKKPCHLWRGNSLITPSGENNKNK